MALRNLLRIDLTGGKVNSEELGEKYRDKGGRALTSFLINEEVDPQCDPLGENNKMVFAAGLLGGSGCSSLGRLSAGAKSPLTGGIKEANSGGVFAAMLARSGYRALVFEGLPSDNAWKVLVIDGDKAYLESAEGLENRGVLDSFRILKDKYGDKIGMIALGQAGEQELPAAAIMASDPFDHARALARGGLGAVMGSKKIKAMVVKDNRGAESPVVDQEKLKELRKKYNNQVLEDPRLENRKQYGTAAIVNPVNAMGALPTYSFSKGSYENVDNITGEALHDTIVAREGKGKVSAPCMRGCLISCGNAYPDHKGEVLVSTLQYETIGMLGSNCGMKNLDDIALLNKMCNDYGLDTIETGATLGILMDEGVIEFGDVEAAADVLRQVAQGTALGKIVGSGALVTGKVYGSSRIPVGRNQAIPAYDPRALKGNGVTYITSPMGADHTAGNCFGARNKVDPLGQGEQVELSKGLQEDMGIVDLLGACLFARTPVFADLDLMADIANAMHGLNLKGEDLKELSRETLRVESEFNKKAGLTTTRYPEFMYQEQLPPHETTFDVPQEEIDSLEF